MEIWRDTLPHNFDKLTIHEYLEISYYMKELMKPKPIVTYDNYLSIFLDRYPDIVNNYIFATHEIECEVDDEDPFYEYKTHDTFYYPWNLPDNIALELRSGQWIVNIDLDYFFYSMHFGTEEKRMFSESYIEDVFSAISKKYNDGSISVLTISLSPECSGGWESAEKLCNEACKILEIPFSLPPVEEEKKPKA